MKSPFIFASLVVVCCFAATHKIEAQKRSAATPSAESIVNAYFRYRVTAESGGALSPTGFRKTNGYEQGYGLYVMEWQAEVLFQQDGYKAGDFFVGYWQNFRVLQQKPGTLDSLIVGNTILFNKGTTVRLTGNATLRKTEKGPRLEAFDVRTSQVLARTTVVPPKPISKPKIATPALSNAAIIATLEPEWNYYVREPISLGPTYFGNTTSFGRYRESAYALELMSGYSRYQALATKGLIKLDEWSLDDAPTTVNGISPEIKRAATVTLTPEGASVGKVDNKKNTVTFVLGTYHVEKIISNTIVQTNEGNYRLVEGTHVLDVVPEFADVWAELGWRTYRERKFRVIFQYDTTDDLYKDTGKAWRVATASNGRFNAQDRGPRNGGFESANVPPTLEQLRARK
jgi:hypothetical protein